MCHRSWSFPTFQLRFLCIVLIFRQMARLPGPALELYQTPASEFQRKECLFLKSANQTWRLSFNGMACGIAYSWSNACGWEDGWSRPPESHMRSWKQWVQSALYHLGRDGSAQRGCDIRVFWGGEKWPWTQCIMFKPDRDHLFTLPTSASSPDSQWPHDCPAAPVEGQRTLLFSLTIPTALHFVANFSRLDLRNALPTSPLPLPFPVVETHPSSFKDRCRSHL